MTAIDRGSLDKPLSSCIPPNLFLLQRLPILAPVCYYRLGVKDGPGDRDRQCHAGLRLFWGGHTSYT